jgi:anti-anti-sigma regulatory factor
MTVMTGATDNELIIKITGAMSSQDDLSIEQLETIIRQSSKDIVIFDLSETLSLTAQFWERLSKLKKQLNGDGRQILIRGVHRSLEMVAESNSFKRMFDVKREPQGWKIDFKRLQ